MQKVEIRIFEYKKELYKRTKFIKAIKLEEYQSDDCEDLAEVIYKVQIIAGLNKLPLNDELFKGEQVSIYTHNGLYKYTVGSFKTKKQADLDCKRLTEKGFVGAFVVELRKGKRID